MQKIMPVSDLRNYNEILRICDAEGLVYLTKHGRGSYVVATNEYLEKIEAQNMLLADLLAGEASIEDEDSWILVDDAREKLGV